MSPWKSGTIGAPMEVRIRSSTEPLSRFEIAEALRAHGETPNFSPAPLCVVCALDIRDGECGCFDGRGESWKESDP